MTKNDFMQYAMRNRLSCGDHYVIKEDGVIQQIHIFANKYDGFLIEHTPDDKGCQGLKLKALKEKTTLTERQER